MPNPKPIPRPKTTILYLGTSASHATFSINGIHWRYYLHPMDLWSLDYIATRWITKGLAHAKRRAYRTERQPSETTTCSLNPSNLPQN